MIRQAVDLIDAFRRRVLSPVEATHEALEAIDRFDDQVNAFVLVDADGARAAAKESEARWYAGEPLGPGDGVPTSIKDALWTRGWPTLRGSTLIDEAGPWPHDAPSVARLRETGAVILGKTTTPEYSWKGVTDSFKYGATGNPWDPTKTSGGSSGGSAGVVSRVREETIASRAAGNACLRNERVGVTSSASRCFTITACWTHLAVAMK